MQYGSCQWLKVKPSSRCSALSRTVHIFRLGVLQHWCVQREAACVIHVTSPFRNTSHSYSRAVSADAQEKKNWTDMSPAAVRILNTWLDFKIFYRADLKIKIKTKSRIETPKNNNNSTVFITHPFVNIREFENIFGLDRTKKKRR